MYITELDNNSKASTIRDVIGWLNTYGEDGNFEMVDLLRDVEDWVVPPEDFYLEDPTSELYAVKTDWTLGLYLDPEEMTYNTKPISKKDRVAISNSWK